MTRPRALDLFCNAGGASMGLHLAGFDIVGVDLVDQPNYPFTFKKADAMTYPLDGFDLIHASPPCQRYAIVTGWRGNPDDHPDLLEPTLERLRSQTTPWVVENVPEAIGRPDLVLCGTMFGLPVKRHRHFLTEPPLFGLLPPCRHKDLFAFEHKWEQAYAEGLGCAWMTNKEAREAIPPAYSKWIGGLMLDTLGMDHPPAGWTLCRHCRKGFVAQRTTALYCSVHCRQNAHYGKTKASTLKPLPSKGWKRR
jgi:DNA (cytosine-5)-methyltransferase 1